MINILSSNKLSKCIRISVYILLFSFCFSLPGCVTTENAAIKENSYVVKEDYEIISIFFKNKTEVYVKDLNPEFIKNKTGGYSGIIFYQKDTAAISDNSKKINYIEMKYEFKDISLVKIQILEHHTLTIVLVAVTCLVLI